VGSRALTFKGLAGAVGKFFNYEKSPGNYRGTVIPVENSRPLSRKDTRDRDHFFWSDRQVNAGLFKATKLPEAYPELEFRDVVADTEVRDSINVTLRKFSQQLNTLL